MWNCLRHLTQLYLNIYNKKHDWQKQFQILLVKNVFLRILLLLSHAHAVKRLTMRNLTLLTKGEVARNLLTAVSIFPSNVTALPASWRGGIGGCGHPGPDVLLPRWWCVYCHPTPLLLSLSLLMLTNNLRVLYDQIFVTARIVVPLAYCYYTSCCPNAHTRTRRCMMVVQCWEPLADGLTIPRSSTTWCAVRDSFCATWSFYFSLSLFYTETIKSPFYFFYFIAINPFIISSGRQKEGEKKQ